MNAKTEYGIVVLAALAAAKGESRAIGAIAEEHGMPSRFLVQILLQFKGAGYVESIRGASGGYKLIVDPKTITMLDIITALEGTGKAKSSATKNTAIVSNIRKTMESAEAAKTKILEKTTLAKLIS